MLELMQLTSAALATSVRCPRPMMDACGEPPSSAAVAAAIPTAGSREPARAQPIQLRKARTASALTLSGRSANRARAAKDASSLVKARGTLIRECPDVYPGWSADGMACLSSLSFLLLRPSHFDRRLRARQAYAALSYPSERARLLALPADLSSR